MTASLLRTPAPRAASAHAPARMPAAVQAIALSEPLPGFPGHREYVLVPAEEGGTLFWLQSLAPDGPRFLAVRAGAFFPDYAPVLPIAVCDELDLADVAEAQLFCLVTVLDGDVATATANLRAPLVVHPDTHRARQVVLVDGTHPIRQPLIR
ncbi:flagellar assembly protein FliW [Blastococcus sp. PRF04-17]|uniref:flagellar assembly protein FliW n=1 Tax=Blastococcus sp. PRF04-17 TaxID=2933797 RepID=UPI001FF2DBA6|nr:flagellar assembly protein FliW [Blastococcus sp. PRF04-17]UOY03905.1 flagellar assembly protein FliW [Blastococcus sp. PRF04-17]